MKFITHQYHRLRHALVGVWFAMRHDSSYPSQVLGGAIAIALFSWWQWPLSTVEILFLGLAYALILITELQNSSFEKALDHLHGERHEAIRQSKDMAAGSVFTAGLFLVFVMVIIIVT